MVKNPKYKKKLKTYPFRNQSGESRHSDQEEEEDDEDDEEDDDDADDGEGVEDAMVSSWRGPSLLPRAESDLADVISAADREVKTSSSFRHHPH